jgi:hypothetical protein
MQPSNRNYDGWIAIALIALLVLPRIMGGGGILANAPIPEAGLHVLIVEETEDRRQLPQSQVNIFTSVTLREYLDSKAKAWRIFDQDVDLERESEVWQKAMGRERASVPWIVVSNGRTGHEGPLPKTVAETLTLIKKYEVD